MNANPFRGGRHPQSQTPSDQEPNHRNSGAVTLTLTDTLSLDTAVQFAINRGASIRLIGDDQQLAAIGAGGVLRDITHTHGAEHLAELHRFTNPAEAAASLALPEGKPEAVNFYLDHDRIHVGDIAKTTEDAFTAWVLDRSTGLDAIMLAPPASLSANSTVAPVIIASTTPHPRRRRRCVWPTVIRPVSEM